MAIAGCHAESALGAVAEAPPGTELIPSNGRLPNWRPNVSTMFYELAREEQFLPSSLFLEALDAISAEDFQKHTYNFNTELLLLRAGTIPPRPGFDIDSELLEYDEDKLLPRYVGIGGTPPRLLSLEETARSMAQQGAKGNLDLSALRQATERLKTVMDPLQDGEDFQRLTANPEALDREEKALDAQIDAIAKRVRKGESPASFNVEDRRIAYGLAYAYAEARGRLDELIRSANASSLPPAAEEARRVLLCNDVTCRETDNPIQPSPPSVIPATRQKEPESFSP